MAIWCDIRGFHYNSDGKFKISNDDLNSFGDLVKFYLNGAQNKENFQFALTCLLEEFERQINHKAQRLDLRHIFDSPYKGLTLELFGMKDYMKDPDDLADKQESPNIKFVLNNNGTTLIAEAPKDITLEQFLKQCDRIQLDWCDCGITSYEKIYEEDSPTEILITYDNIKKANKDVPCNIERG